MKILDIDFQILCSECGQFIIYNYKDIIVKRRTAYIVCPICGNEIMIRGKFQDVHRVKGEVNMDDRKL